MSAKAISSILANHKAKRAEQEQEKKSQKAKKTKKAESESDHSDSDETMSLDGDLDRGKNDDHGKNQVRSESPELPMPQLLSGQFEIQTQVETKADNKVDNKVETKVLSKKNSDALLRMSKTPIAEDSPSSDDSMPKKMEKPKVTKFCKCRKSSRPAREGVTKKAGPNFGRVFFSCSRPMDDDDNCGYFEWAAPAEADLKHGVFCKCTTPGGDDDDEEQESSEDEDDVDGSKAMSKRLAKQKKRDASRIPAVRLQVKKAGPNQGKYFFGCSLGKQKSGCEFFQWDDKANNSKETTKTSQKRKLDSSSDDDDDDDGTF